MVSNHNHIPMRQAGFSLVEIMVGMVIGLLATLVIMQVFTVFEGQKRTTTGSADAQTNGSIALYNIQRDVQMAGFGLPVFDTENAPLKCNPSPVISIDHDSDPVTANINIDMFPIVITDGGVAAGASDSITVRYGPTPAGGIPVKILDPSNATTSGVGVDNNLGCISTDVAFIARGTACAMTRVTALPDSTHIRLASATGVVANASLACLGNWNQFVYSVAGGQLQRNGTPSIADIVNIQAQYGVSSSPINNQVSQWVDASGATWAAPTVTNRNRIKAVRIALVARNGLLEKEDVTTACSSLTAAGPTGLCAWQGSVASPAPTIDLSNDANWRRYRYRVFETVVPLRNMIWSRNTLQ